MREYSPKRRTALVLSGAGSSGAYHAGVLKALDDSGIKVDVIVGSGAGTVCGAFGAVPGGEKLYGEGGFWERAGWSVLYRLRPALRTMRLLLAILVGVFLLPVVLALLAGLLFPFYLAADWALPAWTAWIAERLRTMEGALRTLYLSALVVPVFVLSISALTFVSVLLRRYGHRFGEAFESLLEASGARRALSRGLWEVVRGAAISSGPPSEAELGRRYVTLLKENLGQPGFRELVVRTTDLETGQVLPFFLVAPPHVSAFHVHGHREGGQRRVRREGINLVEEDCDTLLLDAVVTGLMPPVATPLCRVRFPKKSPYPGETHRLTDGTLAGGSGLSEALAVGAEQVIVVSAVPEPVSHLARRRGLRATASAVLATLERNAVDEDLRHAERINRMVQTLGHRTDGGGRAWEDPATGRLYRDIALYIIRPDGRTMDPLGFDGVQDPATEGMETLGDLLERGYRDAFRLFLDPIVGAASESQRPLGSVREEGQHVEL